MQVLLIWEVIPDHTNLYLLEGDIAEAAIKAHQCFVNVVDCDPNGAADRLSDMLDGVKPLDTTKPIELTASTRVVLSGFVL